MKKILSIVLFQALLQMAFCQEQKWNYKVVPVISKETFYLNGGGRATFGGKSRTYMLLELPANTVEWYYAVTSTASQNSTASIGLVGQLLKLLNPGMGIASSAISSLIAPTGVGVCDVYLIGNQNDLNRFLSKQGTFSYLMTGSREQIREGVVQVKEPITGNYFLSLRNPSALTGINICIEVSAIVREKSIDNNSSH